MTTTLADRRDELATALEANGVRVADVAGAGAVPYAVIYGDGISASGTPGGQLLAGFRVALFAGKADAAAAVAELGDLAIRTLGALWTLTGWKVGDIGPDVVRRVGGADLLSADARASALFIPTYPQEDPGP